MQAYSNPKRESDPHALPDVEVWFEDGKRLSDDVPEAYARGWYWWPCFPGCLPDSDPVGPFETEAEALADAQADSEED